MLKKIADNAFAVLLARLILGFMFILVGVGKIAGAEHFAKEIGNYRMLPEMLVNIMAITLPWIELAVGIMILYGIRLKANAALAAGLLLVFIIAVGTAWGRGLNINCGCYSNIAQQTVGLPKILENLGLMLLAAIIYFFPRKEFCIESYSHKEQDSEHLPTT